MDTDKLIQAYINFSILAMAVTFLNLSVAYGILYILSKTVFDIK